MILTEYNEKLHNNTLKEEGIEIGEKKKAKEQTFIGQLLCCDYMIP